MGVPYRAVTTLAVLVALAAVFLSSKPPATSDSSFSPIPGRNGTVLFFINTEYGLSNVHLATASGLLEKYPCTEIHVASFPRTASKLRKLSTLARRKSPATRNIYFHELPGPEYSKAFSARLGTHGNFVHHLMHPPGMKGLGTITSQVQAAISPWEAEDHIKLFDKAENIIQDVDPSVVVLDTTLRPAIQAAWKSNRTHAYISPNALVDAFAGDQPYWGFLWKYSRMGSDFPFPVPWRKIPENIIVTAGFIYSVLIRNDFQSTKKQLEAHGIQDPARSSRLNRPWIAQYLPGASIPLDFIPPNVTCTGPIVLDEVPAIEQDAELTAWLSRAPTVLINLGSLFTYKEEHAKTMALAIASILAETNVQVIWKMKKEGAYSDADVFLPVQKYIEKGRLKISEWLGANPVSLLGTGHIIASIHHGGANCYNEAIAAGVPQVIIPMWFDLYNYAQLAEEIGVGVYATRGTAPNWTAEDLRRSFLKVVDGGQDSLRMRNKAKELGELAQKEPGRLTAAREIARLARSECV
ncbi:hypothetical protein F5B22DRAFT_538212 [Xylaria bambusicola]|uniref:uncharacterized protein n=1 Tax=Xylaria bambusicola TaxID=326684 RepID=UPI00200752EA|nr:uncharacterized protein F5B22DRAFT_538212 [Xylaria bambusicola]KAI0505116.1 hypothetical protein F5B22DRAFT_538212 [Xylaria bambusicola]